MIWEEVFPQTYPQIIYLKLHRNFLQGAAIVLSTDDIPVNIAP